MKIFNVLVLLLLMTSNAYAVSTSTCNDTDTKLALHMNGTDGSTIFTDSSASPHTVTAQGNAQIDTAQSKFGGASGLFDGTGDYLTTPDSSDWDLGSGDFTIEHWIRFNSVTPLQGFINHDTGAGTRAYRWYWNNNGNLEFSYSTDGTNLTNASFSFSPVVNTWYHIVLVRNGADLKVFVDGTQVGSTYNIGATTIFNSSSTFWVASGVSGGGASQETLNGWMDELRIVKGLAIWTANFTAPSAEYTDGCILRRRVISTVIS